MLLVLLCVCYSMLFGTVCYIQCTPFTLFSMLAVAVTSLKGTAQIGVGIGSNDVGGASRSRLLFVCPDRTSRMSSHTDSRGPAAIVGSQYLT